MRRASSWGAPVVASVMEYSFIGGSMGAVVGEAITRAVERAADSRTPLIIVSASGGARMMEGVISLMQLAKISSALARLDKAKVPYISLLTDPTTGGVTASFAMLGDLNIAEPGALIGFAGPRVIEQTIRQKLPAGLSTQRVPAGAWHARCRRSPQAAEALHRARAGFHGGLSSGPQTSALRHQPNPRARLSPEWLPCSGHLLIIL